MNLSEILPEMGPCTFWLHDDYGDPRRANFYDFRAVLVELTPEQLASPFAGVGPDFLPRIANKYTLWIHNHNGGYPPRHALCGRRLLEGC